MPVIAIAPAAAIFAQNRGRPGTTSMNATPIERIAIGADRDRRRGVALPARELLHAERPRPQGDQLEPLQESSGDAEGDHPDHEMAPAAEPRRREHEEHTERREPDARTDGVRLACERVEPPGADRDDGVGDPRVEPVERAGIDAEPQAAGDDDGHQQDQPEPSPWNRSAWAAAGQRPSADDVGGW